MCVSENGRNSIASIRPFDLYSITTHKILHTFAWKIFGFIMSEEFFGCRAWNFAPENVNQPTNLRRFGWCWNFISHRQISLCIKYVLFYFRCSEHSTVFYFWINLYIIPWLINFYLSVPVFLILSRFWWIDNIHDIYLYLVD